MWLMRLNALQTFWVRVAARDAAFLGYKVLSRPLQSEDFNFNALKRLQSGAMRDQSVSGGALMSGLSVACYLCGFGV